jgi:hypothetical protein
MADTREKSKRPPGLEANESFDFQSSAPNTAYTHDGTDNIGNHKFGLSSGPSDKHGSGHIIHFIHVPTRETCHFKAFLTSWNDQFKQDWKDYTTVGRMDAIKVFSRTSREINFSFSVPSFDLEEAAYNLQQIETLIQMSYPTFESVNLASGGGQSNTTTAGSAEQAAQQSAINNMTQEQAKLTYSSVSTMVSPPFFRVKFANWLNDPNKDGSMTAIDAAESGLYGVINNVKFEPDLSADGGFFSSDDLYGNRISQSEKILIPKLLKIDINFVVLHTNPLGYDANTKSVRTPNFPYNASRILSKVRGRTIKVK